jgi:hypothetical protein
VQQKKSHRTDVRWLKISNQRNDEVEQVFDCLAMGYRKVIETLCFIAGHTNTEARD